MFAVGTAVSVSTQNINLHNATAETTIDCPDSTHSFLHFVIAPNDGTFTIQSIALSIGGSTQTFSGPAIIPKGSQHDNVFVQVPAGHSVIATITPDSPAPDSFNLSSVCVASESPTTTTAPRTTTATSMTKQPAGTTVSPSSVSTPVVVTPRTVG
jgi:hypothetical protein